MDEKEIIQILLDMKNIISEVYDEVVALKRRVEQLEEKNKSC